MSHGVRACGAPSAFPVTVLKFGSSVLEGADGYRRAASEVDREVAAGRRVVAVVSAMGRTTDDLLTAAREIDDSPPDALLGQLLAAGEGASVAMFSIALTSIGIHAVGLSPERFHVDTRGRLSDAEPVAIDRDALLTLLETHDAVVVAGFVGRDASGAPSLLGRGGSDLTALFLGDSLKAAEVRLVKDVDGVFPADPKESGPSSPLRVASWGEVRRIGTGVVQEKALDFAERRRLPFRVAAVGGVGTWVGPAAERDRAEHGASG